MAKGEIVEFNGKNIMKSHDKFIYFRNEFKFHHWLSAESLTAMTVEVIWEIYVDTFYAVEVMSGIRQNFAVLYGRITFVYFLICRLIR